MRVLSWLGAAICFAAFVLNLLVGHYLLGCAMFVLGLYQLDIAWEARR